MPRAYGVLHVQARLTVEMTHDGSPAAKESVGAGDENRTRTVSLGNVHPPRGTTRSETGLTADGSDRSDGRS